MVTHIDQSYMNVLVDKASEAMQLSDNFVKQVLAEISAENWEGATARAAKGALSESYLSAKLNLINQLTAHSSTSKQLSTEIMNAESEDNTAILNIART